MTRASANAEILKGIGRAPDQSPIDCPPKPGMAGEPDNTVTYSTRRATQPVAKAITPAIKTIAPIRVVFCDA